MGYLTIKQINGNNIDIQSIKQYYSVGYNTNYLKLSSISLKLKNISIIENSGYYIYINDKKSINDIKLLDSFLTKHIPNYKCILHNSYNKQFQLINYLYLKKNDYLDNFMKKFTGNEIYINIIKLKKNASHTFPIVYVL
tara:strand:+ start:258 stop:674 length:417 start_codon:yes stop_codon:yes gene_type:complete